MTRKPFFMAMIAALALTAPPATAQLYGNFAAARNHAKSPVNVWFGAVRNASGQFLPNATIILETKQVDFVAVTNRQGRYRLELPVSIKPSDVKARCSLKGYSSAKIIRRLPRGGALTPVQMDCELH